MKPNTTFEGVGQIPFGAQVDTDPSLQEQADKIIEEARLEMKSRAFEALRGGGSGKDRPPYEPRIYPHRWWECL